MSEIKSNLTNDKFINGVINALKCANCTGDILCDECAYQIYIRSN